MDEAKQEYITFQIEGELKEKFQAKCASEDITISQQLRRMIKTFLGEIEQ